MATLKLLEHNPKIFMRRLIDGEIDPPPSKTRPSPDPARCKFCKCEDFVRPLYMASQLMRAEWITCPLCFHKFGRLGKALDCDFTGAMR
jgi:hypothetical protein